MACTMTPRDVRDLLEGYCLDETLVLPRTGTLTADSTAVTGIDASGLRPLMKVSGEGVQDGTVIASVGESVIELSLPATASGTDVALTVTTFLQISDEWLANARDRKVIPYVESKAGVKLGATTRKVEYHSGTGSSLLFLDRRPIVELHSINLVTNPANWVYVSPNSVDVIAEEGVLKLKAVLEAWQAYVPAFPRGKMNVKVEYTYGYAEAPCDLVDAVNGLVASLALGHLGARTGGGSVSVPGMSRNYGPRGKYGDVRIELERWAVAAIRRYMTGVSGW